MFKSSVKLQLRMKHSEHIRGDLQGELSQQEWRPRLLEDIALTTICGWAARHCLSEIHKSYEHGGNVLRCMWERTHNLYRVIYCLISRTLSLPNTKLKRQCSNGCDAEPSVRHDVSLNFCFFSVKLFLVYLTVTR